MMPKRIKSITNKDEIIAPKSSQLFRPRAFETDSGGKRSNMVRSMDFLSLVQQCHNEDGKLKPALHRVAIVRIVSIIDSPEKDARKNQAHISYSHMD
ncbi:hypothetical protein Csa_011156 [Cucumis sativus]|uniref:Uncharacterized protein n=1 Tax=Cucumis sativus TaxID=3659 RepID=A0A0A0L9B7_CUCSA|nr:hypothetical protein Csa_011156 [Cucumis sativus]